MSIDALTLMQTAHTSDEQAAAVSPTRRDTDRHETLRQLVTLIHRTLMEAR